MASRKDPALRRSAWNNLKRSTAPGKSRICWYDDVSFLSRTVPWTVAPASSKSLISTPAKYPVAPVTSTGSSVGTTTMVEKCQVKCLCKQWIQVNQFQRARLSSVSTFYTLYSQDMLDRHSPQLLGHPISLDQKNETVSALVRNSSSSVVNMRSRSA